MDVTRILTQAHEAVVSADLPAELHEPAFVKAVELLSRDFYGHGDQHQESTGLTGQVERPSGADLIGRISARLSLDREQAERVFHVEDERLQLAFPSSKLSSAKKTATEEIALLVTAGRQASGLDEESTNAEQIRTVAEYYRRYDSPNFSRTLKDMSDVFIIREDGRKKMLKMTQPGWEKAAELIDRLLAG